MALMRNDTVGGYNGKVENLFVTQVDPLPSRLRSAARPTLPTISLKAEWKSGENNDYTTSIELNHDEALSLIEELCAMIRKQRMPAYMLHIESLAKSSDPQG